MFVIFSGTKDKVEIWLPFSRQRNPILTRSKKAPNEWSDQTYTLKGGDKLSLWREGELYYEEP